MPSFEHKNFRVHIHQDILVVILSAWCCYKREFDSRSIMYAYTTVIHQSEKVGKLVPLMPLTNYPWQQKQQKPKAICTDDWRHWWSRWSPVVLNPGSRTQLTERKQFREEHFSIWWNMFCKAFTGIIFGTAEEYLTRLASSLRQAGL